MTATYQRIGLVVNSAAGGNAENALRAGSGAVSALGAAEIVTGPGPLGADAVADLGLRVEVCDIGSGSGRERTMELAYAFAERQLDSVLVVGGDGTMSDVAAVFAGTPHRPDILGIGAGSANAGALVTCLANEVERLNPKHLQAQEHDALVVNVLDGPSAIAFNDCVFGTTVIGTIENDLVDLDAVALLQGRQEVSEPQPIGEADTSVRVIGPDCDEQLSKGVIVGTVVVGFAEQSFRAKAITGGVCLATYVGLPAGCLVAERPLAYVGASADTLRLAGPIRTVFMAIDADKKIIVTGVRNGTTVCADGNPVAVLRTTSAVEVHCKPMAISGLTMRNRNR